MAKRLNYIFRTYLIYFIFKIAVPLWSRYQFYES
jgi:hypothetical protein